MSTVEDSNIEPPLTIEVEDITNNDSEQDDKTTPKTRYTPRTIPTFHKSLTPKEKNYIHKFINSLKK